MNPRRDLLLASVFCLASVASAFAMAFAITRLVIERLTR